MTTETAISAAMQRAGGFSPSGAALLVAISRYFNGGGTVKEFEAICARALKEQLSGAQPGGGHRPRAHKGQIMHAPASHDGGGGHSSIAEKGHSARAAPPSPEYRNGDGLPDYFEWTTEDHRRAQQNRGGAGQQDVAGKAISTVPSPAREPSAADLRAMRTVDVKLTIMDTLRIGGRRIGDWTIGEALSAGRENVRNGHILLAVAKHYANADPAARVRDLIKVQDLQRIVQKAAELADAA